MPYLGTLYSHSDGMAFAGENDTYSVPKINWLDDWISYRIGENRNVLAMYVGGTGTGKSYAALSTALMRDPDFDIHRVVFSVSDFLNEMKIMKKGEVIIFDDAGLGVASKDWRETQVKVFGKVTQSFRFKQLITLMTTPDMTFIENTSRKLINILFQADDVKQGLFYPKIPYTPRNYNSNNIVTYFAYPRIHINGMSVQVKRIRFPLVPSSIADEYEKLKANFIENYYDKYAKDIEKLNNRKNGKKKMNPKSLANLKQNRNKSTPDD